MKKLALLGGFLIAFGLVDELQAQSTEKLIYFYVEDLTVQNYQELTTNNGEKSTEITVGYTCIPAQIIGVKKKYAKSLESNLKSAQKTIQRTELTREEAEKRCANTRRSH